MAHGHLSIQNHSHSFLSRATSPFTSSAQLLQVKYELNLWDPGTKHAIGLAKQHHPSLGHIGNFWSGHQLQKRPSRTRNLNSKIPFTASEKWSLSYSGFVFHVARQQLCKASWQKMKMEEIKKQSRKVNSKDILRVLNQGMSVQLFKPLMYFLSM